MDVEACNIREGVEKYWFWPAGKPNLQRGFRSALELEGKLQNLDEFAGILIKGI